MHLLEIEITNRCNLKCKYCYNRNDINFDLSIEDIINLIRFAEINHVHTLVISGGEAILHPYFDEINEYLRKLNSSMRTVIQSNGLIGQKNVEAVRGFKVVHLSFEPEDTEVRSISVVDTLNTALMFQREGIDVYFFVTVHAKNIDRIEWAIEVANEAGIKIGFNLCSPAGEHKELQLTFSEAELVARRLHRYYTEGKILRFTYPLVSILDSLKSSNYEGIRGGCTAGVASCTVLPNGDVISCPFLRIVAGNIHTQNLTDVWLHSEIFKVLRERTFFDNPCGSCEHLSYCGGCRKRALEHSGKLNGSDPFCFKRKLIVEEIQ